MESFNKIKSENTPKLSPYITQKALTLDEKWKRTDTGFIHSCREALNNTQKNEESEALLMGKPLP
jgi:hypothetical protein